MKLKSPRTKQQIEDSIATNYFLLADFVVKKTGPVKTYGEFARLTGCANLSEIRKGDRGLPLVSAVLACEIFSCSPEWMFMNTGEMFGKEDVARRTLDLEERVSIIEKKLKIK